MLKAPLPSVTPLNFVRVPLADATTLTPGFTPPAESTTVPDSVVVAWAAAGTADHTNNIAARNKWVRILVIYRLPKKNTRRNLHARGAKRATKDRRKEPL